MDNLFLKIKEKLSEYPVNYNSSKAFDLLDATQFTNFLNRREPHHFVSARAIKGEWAHVYSRYIDSIVIEDCNVEELFEKLVVLYSHSHEEGYFISGHIKESPNNLITLNISGPKGDSSVCALVASNSFTVMVETYTWVTSLFKAFTSTDKYKFFVLLNGGEGYYFSQRSLPSVPLINSNYTDEVVKKVNFSIECLKADNPPGRVVIMEGAPGTGKTYAIRHIIKNICDNVKVIALPVSMVPELSGPSLLETLLHMSNSSEGKTKFCFIIEDSDAIINSSDSQNISQILNLGDGIIGESLDSRMILTTNLKKGHINKAITRPGRLASYIEFKDLSPEMASNCAANLGSKKVYTQPVPLAEVYREINEGELFKKTEEKNAGQYL